MRQCCSSPVANSHLLCPIMELHTQRITWWCYRFIERSSEGMWGFLMYRWAPECLFLHFQHLALYADNLIFFFFSFLESQKLCIQHTATLYYGRSQFISGLPLLLGNSISGISTESQGCLAGILHLDRPRNWISISPSLWNCQRSAQILTVLLELDSWIPSLSTTAT